MMANETVNSEKRVFCLILLHCQKSLHRLHPSKSIHVQEADVILSSLTHRPLEWRPTGWVSLLCFVTLYSVSVSYLFPLCPFPLPAPVPELSPNQTRPDPEGESSPPKTENIQRMESPAKKDPNRRLATPTKTDVISQSPGSPASPVSRSKRGKQEYIFL